MRRDQFEDSGEGRIEPWLRFLKFAVGYVAGAIIVIALAMAFGRLVNAIP